MLTALGLSLSAGFAQVMTNLDNLALMMALLPILGARVAASAYMIAQVVVLAAALLLAEALADFGAGISGFAGAFPIAIGIWAIWRRRKEVGRDPNLAPKSLGVTVLMFLGLSGDSFAVLAPLILDTKPGLRLMIVIGSLLATGLLAAAALSLSRMTTRIQGLAERLDRFAPYVMIAVGFYILLDTATDHF